MLELVKQFLGRQVLVLQSTDEFEQILVRDDVRRGGRELSKQVVNERTLQPVALGRQVDDPVGE